MEWWKYALFVIPALINLAALWHIAIKSTRPYPEKMRWGLFAIFIPVVAGLMYFCLVIIRSKKTT